MKNHSDVKTIKSDAESSSKCHDDNRFLWRVWDLYYDGFRSMTIGKTLWVIILLKLFVFFVVIKLFFFPNLLKTGFDNDKERADHVRQEMIKRGKQNDSQLNNLYHNIIKVPLYHKSAFN